MPIRFKYIRIGNRRHDQLSSCLEGNEALVKQMIDRRCQQEAILAIEPLLVAAVAPRLDVTRDRCSMRSTL